MLFALLALAARSWRTAEPIDRAGAAYRRGDWREAVREARARLTAAPEDRRAMRWLARSAARLGRDTETESLYARLGARDAEAEDFFLLGSSLLRRGQGGPGLRMIEQAGDRDPANPEILTFLAEQYQRSGFPIAAAAAARKLASAAGSGPRGHWILAQQLLALDRPAEAAAAALEVLARDPGGEVLKLAPATVRKQLARAWLRAGRGAEAREALAPLPRDPVDPEAEWLLSRALLQCGDRAGAEQALARAGRFGQDDRTRPEPAPWAGNSRCAECHPRIHRSQQASRHARTLFHGRALNSLALPTGPVKDPGDPGVEHRLNRAAEGVIQLTVSGSERVFTAVMAYAIGSGNRGWTPLVRTPDGMPWEYRLTRYADPVGWNTTIHHRSRPEVTEAFLGVPMIEDQVRDCLNCHLTNPDAVLEGRPDAAEARGIDCERCHGPAGNHLQAVKLGLAEMAVAQPRLATAEQRDTLCAQCHRAAPGVPEDSPESIRFQSPNLARSRCHIESAGAMDCTTCHNPHRDAVSEPAAYDAICLTCHGRRDPAASPRANPAGGRSPVAASACPVNPERECVKCHMPRVQEVIPHTSYTDHFIRVHRE